MAKHTTVHRQNKAIALERARKALKTATKFSREGECGAARIALRNGQTGLHSLMQRGDMRERSRRLLARLSVTAELNYVKHCRR